MKYFNSLSRSTIDTEIQEYENGNLRIQNLEQKTLGDLHRAFPKDVESEEKSFFLFVLRGFGFGLVLFEVWPAVFDSLCSSLRQPGKRIERSPCSTPEAAGDEFTCRMTAARSTEG